jgi:NAD(P)H:quinone oxidoreductase type IV
MAKVLVLYYSAYGHIEAMANAVAEGVREAGAQVDIKRVPETVPEQVAEAHHFKLNQTSPIATIDELVNYDAVIVGTGTRFGRVSSQMAAFLDQAGGSMDERRSTRKSRRRVHLDRHPAWRPGDHPYWCHRQFAAFRDGDRRP